MKFSKNISVASNKLDGVVIILGLGVVVDVIVGRDEVVIETKSNRDVADSTLGGVDDEEDAGVQSPQTTLPVSLSPLRALLCVVI